MKIRFNDDHKATSTPYLGQEIFLHEEGRQ
jgi:hypothetical protein